MRKDFVSKPFNSVTSVLCYVDSVKSGLCYVESVKSGLSTVGCYVDLVFSVMSIVLSRAYVMSIV